MSRLYHAVNGLILSLLLLLLLHTSTAYADHSLSSDTPDPTTLAQDVSQEAGTATEPADVASTSYAQGPIPQTFTLSGVPSFSVPTGGVASGGFGTTDSANTTYDIAKGLFCIFEVKIDVVPLPTGTSNCPVGMALIDDPSFLGCMDKASRTLLKDTVCPTTATVVNRDCYSCDSPDPTTFLCPPGQKLSQVKLGLSARVFNQRFVKNGRQTVLSTDDSTVAANGTNISGAPLTATTAYCHSADPKVLGLTGSSTGSCGPGLTPVPEERTLCMSPAIAGQALRDVDRPSTPGGPCLIKWARMDVADYACFSPVDYSMSQPDGIGSCQVDGSYLMLSNSTPIEILRRRLGDYSSAAPVNKTPLAADGSWDLSASLYGSRANTTSPLFIKQYCYSATRIGITLLASGQFTCAPGDSLLPFGFVYCLNPGKDISLDLSYDDYGCDPDQTPVNIKDYYCKNAAQNKRVLPPSAQCPPGVKIAVRSLTQAVNLPVL